MEQLSFFTDGQEEVIETALARRDNIGTVPVQFTKAQDKSTWDMFIALTMWALQGPIHVEKSMVANAEFRLVDKYRWDIAVERFIKVIRWCRELREETQEAGTKKQLQETLRAFLRRGKDIQKRLTNWEVCLIFMECSLKAPLMREATTEYFRAFAHCFGIEKYVEIVGHPLNLDDLKMMRYYEKGDRLPHLNDDEIQWVKDFNYQVQHWGETYVLELGDPIAVEAA